MPDDAHPIRLHPAQARARIQALEASKLREVANAGFGRPDVLKFWFGESDQTTPLHIREAAAQALLAGRTFYTHNFGAMELREGLSAYLGRLHGTAIPADRVAVTSSGISALMIAMQAILEPGDRAVVVTPVWPSLAEIPRILGAEVVRAPLRGDNGAWRLDLDALLNALTPGTRLLLINSPGNPTGWTLAPEHRAPLLAHCRRHGIWLLTDDVYERLVYDGAACAPSFLPLADPDDRLVSTNSFSKAWLMTGWRLGWMVAPPALQTDLGKLLEYNTSCAPDFVQAGGLRAIGHGEADVAALRAHLAARRDQLVAGLSGLPSVSAVAPEGGMYVFFRMAGAEDSVTLAKRLILEADLGLAPGAAFGPEGEGWIRWCFATGPERIDEGLARLAGWLEGQGRASATG